MFGGRRRNDNGDDDDDGNSSFANIERGGSDDGIVHGW